MGWFEDMERAEQERYAQEYECYMAYKDGYEQAIDDMKQFLYKHKHIDYTLMLGFLDNLEKLKAGVKNEID